MAWTKYLVLFLVGCQTLRTIDICQVDSPRASCAVKKKQYTLKWPEEMLGHSCFDEVALNLLAGRLAECKAKNRLPSNDDTLNEMNICLNDVQGCGQNLHENMLGYYCVPPVSLQKIKSRLEYCTR
jgi:hypothetical protein